MHADDVESDEEVRIVGRPCLSLLDTLIVEVHHVAPRADINVQVLVVQGGGHHEQRCGCWHGEQHCLASSASASKSPGELVAADNAQEGISG